MIIYNQFTLPWLHDKVKDQLLSPNMKWMYPNFGSDNYYNLNKSSFANMPFCIESNRYDFSGCDSLIYVLENWIETNKDVFQFKDLNRCLINFYTAGQNTGWHVDHANPNMHSLLYYVNESDGGTEFEDMELRHKENTGVFFKSDIRHSPISSTGPRRISVNWLIVGSLK